MRLPLTKSKIDLIIVVLDKRYTTIKYYDDKVYLDGGMSDAGTADRHHPQGPDHDSR